VGCVGYIGASVIEEKGTICARRGITGSCPAGTGWEFVIGVINSILYNK